MKIETLRKLVGTGRFATVVFTTDKGVRRTLNGRTGVTKDLKGTGKKFDADAKGLLVIWDRNKKAYRSIRAENVISVSADKSKLAVTR
jgi:hypothetical protein